MQRLYEQQRAAPLDVWTPSQQLGSFIHPQSTKTFNKMSGRQQRVMVQPINVIFKHLQAGQLVNIWLYDNTEFRLEGKIIGFDEFMNVVLDHASEVWVKSKKATPHRDAVEKGARVPLGRLLLKGENITLIEAMK